MPQDNRNIAIEVLYLPEGEPDRSLIQSLNDKGIHCHVMNDLVQLVEKTAELQSKAKLLLLQMSTTNIRSTMRDIRLTLELPVVVLLDSSDPHDEVLCFENDVDDCIIPGRGYSVVRERILSVMRRSGMLMRRLSAGSVEIEPSTRSCWVEGERVTLTPKEFSLLEYLLRNQEHVLTRENILTALWGYDYDGETRTVDTVIKQLRRKLGNAATLIRSVYGVGYQFSQQGSN